MLFAQAKGSPGTGDPITLYVVAGLLGLLAVAVAAAYAVIQRAYLKSGQHRVSRSPEERMAAMDNNFRFLLVMVILGIFALLAAADKLDAGVLTFFGSVAGYTLGGVRSNPAAPKPNTTPAGPAAPDQAQP